MIQLGIISAVSLWIVKDYLKNLFGNKLSTGLNKAGVNKQYGDFGRRTRPA